MGYPGVRHPRHDIRLRIITSGKHSATAITHFLHAHSLVGRRGVSIVNPQKGTDLHILTRRRQRLRALRGDNGNLSGAKFPLRHVAQIQIGKAFKGYAESILLLPHRNRRAPQPVSGRQNPLRRHEQYSHGAVYQLLCILNAFDQVVPLIDHRRHKLRGVNVSSAHLKEMALAVLKNLRHNLILIINLTHSGYGVGAMVRADNQRLGLIVRNTAYSQRAVHLVYVLVKFRAKRRIFDIMDCPVKTLLLIIQRHTGPSGPQMGMIIRPKKQVKDTVFLRCHSKKAAHIFLHLICIYFTTAPAAFLNAVQYLLCLSVNFLIALAGFAKGRSRAERHTGKFIPAMQKLIVHHRNPAADTAHLIGGQLLDPDSEGILRQPPDAIPAPEIFLQCIEYIL